MKLDLYLPPFTKIDSKWIIVLCWHQIPWVRFLQITHTHTPCHSFNLAGIFLCMSLICFSSAPVLFGFFYPILYCLLFLKCCDWLWVAGICERRKQCDCGRQLRDGWVKMTNFFNVLIFEVEMLMTPKENSLLVLKSP